MNAPPPLRLSGSDLWMVPRESVNSANVVGEGRIARNARAFLPHYSSFASRPRPERADILTFVNCRTKGPKFGEI